MFKLKYIFKICWEILYIFNCELTINVCFKFTLSGSLILCFNEKAQINLIFLQFYINQHLEDYADIISKLIV